MPHSSREDRLHFACYSRTAFPVYKSVSQKILCAVSLSPPKAIWFPSPGTTVVDFQQYIYISNQDVNTSHFLTLFICISSDRNCPWEQGHPTEPLVLSHSSKQETKHRTAATTQIYFSIPKKLKTRNSVPQTCYARVHCLNTKSDKKFSYLEHNCCSVSVVPHV